MSDRTFSLMANIDELNAAWMLLRTADGKADFLDGMVHGSNLAPALDGMSPAYNSGHAVGIGWRTKTEDYRKMQSANGKLGGRPSTKSGGLPPHNHRFSDGEAMPKLSDTGLQIKDSCTKEGCTEGTRTASGRGRKSKADESLDGILQGGQGTPLNDAYWKLVSTFGGQAKNPAPKTTARLYVAAITAGTLPELIQAKAQGLRNATSELKYMPQMAKWLEGEGWRNPDVPPPAPRNLNRHPNRNADAEAAVRAQLDELYPPQEAS